MKTELNIKKQLAQPEVMEYINEILNANRGMHRTDLSKHLCEKFGFHDHRGYQQIGSCLIALRELASKGHFELPAPRKTKRKGQPRRLNHPVAEPLDVPSSVGEIKQLELIRVIDLNLMRVWNELIAREHPQGPTQLVGRQVRYLISSEHGWLGALSFSSSAITLHDRDIWIGWSETERQQYLERVICLSRFLIRPSVHCHNLASHLLGMCLRRISDDFEKIYNYRPWLVESFVDTSRFRGTCYQASNWIKVGRTTGRGRNDRTKQASLALKDIYIYPLVPDFRHRMGLSPDKGAGPLPLSYGLTAEEWVEQEFGSAEFGDQRLTNRLITIAHDFSLHPGCSYATATGGDKSAVKAYYRFIDKPPEDPVTMKAILQPHRENTIRRMEFHPEVLVVHDGSELNFATLIKCENLGIIGKNQTKTETRGLYLHSSIAVSSDGLPLGLLKADCIARELKPDRKGKDLRYIPIEEKNTYQWVLDLKDCSSVASLMPGTQVIYVADREADFFELFDEWRTTHMKNVQILVRGQHNHHIVREEDDAHLLFEALKNKAPQGYVKVSLKRQSERPKKGKTTKKVKPARKATLSITYARFQMCPAKYGLNSQKDPIPLWGIHVFEENPPVDCDEPVNWYLLTTLPLTTFDRVLEIVRYYGFRWRIEDWHRVIKHCCQIEKSQYATAERIGRSIAIKLVIGWRIMVMTLLARETPNISSEVIFTKSELQVLSLVQKKKR